eukprot:5388780-Prymnesium_polylepis.1
MSGRGQRRRSRRSCALAGRWRRPSERWRRCCTGSAPSMARALLPAPSRLAPGEAGVGRFAWERAVNQRGAVRILYISSVNSRTCVH